jgi:hypothetical protein
MDCCCYFLYFRYAHVSYGCRDFILLNFLLCHSSSFIQLPKWLINTCIITQPQSLKDLFGSYFHSFLLAMLFEVLIMEFSSCVPTLMGFVAKSTTVVASHSVTVNNNVSYLITSPTPHGVIKSSIISPFIRSTFKIFVTISIT